MPLDLTDAVGWTEKLLKLKSNNFSCFVHCIESRNQGDTSLQYIKT